MPSDQPGTPATSDERRVEAWLIAHAIARSEALAPENARKHKATIVDIAIRAAIREARPLIEAETRRKVADEINAAAFAHHAKDADYSEAYYDGMDDAAEIARGET